MPAQPRLASTVILLRNGISETHNLEIFMVRRSVQNVTNFLMQAKGTKR